MVGKQKQPTKSQQKRFNAIQNIGCLACRKMGYYEVPAEIHHLLNGYRRGHDYSLGLCEWHHRGITQMDKGQAYQLLGPSLAVNKKEFEMRFGTDDELLSEQNGLIEQWEGTVV